MIDFTKDEKLIAEGILYARKVQEFLWKELSQLQSSHFNITAFVNMFQKRVDKIALINPSHGSAKIELRKRILQQAALSILALRILDKEMEK